jgi:hypothetical protein
MKNLIIKRLSVVVVMLALSAGVFAFFAGVEGKYKGTVTVEGMGNLDVTAELKGSDEKLSGVIYSTQGDAQIVEGNAKDGKIMLQIAVGDMTATINGTVDDKGKITGTMSGGQLNGTIELTRVEDASK